MDRAEMISRVAQAWASMNGKAEAFDRCREDPWIDLSQGYVYMGHMADAEELLKRAGLIE